MTYQRFTERNVPTLYSILYGRHRDLPEEEQSPRRVYSLSYAGEEFKLLLTAKRLTAKSNPVQRGSWDLRLADGRWLKARVTRTYQRRRVIVELEAYEPGAAVD